MTGLFTNKTLGISKEVSFLEGDLSIPNRDGVPKLMNYGEGLAKLLLDILRPDAVCIDAGAHIGLTSLIMSRVAGTVISFEPAKDTYALLCANLKETQCQLINAALSNANEDLQFSFKRSFSGGAHKFAPGYHDPEEQTALVKGIRGDGFFADEPRIDFVKLDVEGSELAALNGLRDTLTSHLPILLVEINPPTTRDFGKVQLAELYRFFDLLRPRMLFWFNQDTAETVYIQSEESFLATTHDQAVRDMLVIPV